jgi:hypothetical protein
MYIFVCVKTVFFDTLAFYLRHIPRIPCNTPCVGFIQNIFILWQVWCLSLPDNGCDDELCVIDNIFLVEPT